MIATHICSPLDSVTQSLEIRHGTEKFEIEQLRAALNDEHYLKAGRPAGNTIWQGIYQNGGDEGYPILCAALSQDQRRAVGLNVRNEHGRLVMPSYGALNNFINGIDTEVSPFPHIAQIIKCTRLYRPTQKGAEPEMSVRLFGTSHAYGSKSAAQISKWIREHWSVENLNHWKRDASYWREDRAPKRNPKGAKNLGPPSKRPGLAVRSRQLGWKREIALIRE